MRAGVRCLGALTLLVLFPVAALAADEDATSSASAPIAGSDRSADEAGGISQAIADVKKDMETVTNVSRESARTLKDLVQRFDTLAQELDKATECLARQERELTELKNRIPPQLPPAQSSQRGSRIAWGQATTVVTIGVCLLLMFWILRLQQGRTNRKPALRKQCDLQLTCRSSDFAQLGGAVKERWLKLQAGDPWNEHWVQLVQDTLQGLMQSGTIECRKEAAMLLVDTWIPFVAQFEADRQHWIWTRHVAEQTCPRTLRVEISPGAEVGRVLSQGGSEIAEIDGGGVIVREVLCPVRRVYDATDQLLAEGKAVIRTGG
jgi:hypothetical protein